MEENITKQNYTVLCFGDSNTYGQKPDFSGRYDRMTRWSSRVATLLGNEYYVIEEGLGGRFTDLESVDTTKPTKNGWTYFRPCFRSHDPDFVVLLLGTNDAQKYYQRTATDIAMSIKAYVEYIQDEGARVLLVAPVAPDRERFFDETVVPKNEQNFNETSANVLDELPGALRKLSEETDIDFLDANEYVTVGVDGLHWTAEGHRAFASVCSEKIRQIAAR